MGKAKKDDRLDSVQSRLQEILSVKADPKPKGIHLSTLAHAQTLAESLMIVIEEIKAIKKSS